VKLSSSDRPTSDNSDNIRVSVAIATYNGSRFLREQLDSIASQTLTPAELIVSDDGSSDNTLEIVRSFAQFAPFPVHILEKKERLGFADNFLFAAEQCQYEYIALCDQDDRWLPDKLAVAIDRMQTDGSLLSLHRLMVTDVDLSFKGIFNQDIVGDACYAPLQLDPYATGWGNTMVVRREILHLIPRAARPRQFEQPKPLSHDTWIYVLSAALGSVSHISEPLILYRQHGANVYGMRPTRRFERFEKLDTLWKVPVGVHRERLVFNMTFAPLLREFAKTQHPLAAAAAHAAEQIEARAHLLKRRLAVHEGASMMDRLSAFRTMLRDRASGQGKRASSGALAKDFVLGVLGFGLHR
jgi:glycosyltransferase involved in cell wall biosynthesis